MMPRSYNSRPYASRKLDQDFINRVEAVLKQHPGAGVDRMEVHYVPLSNQNAGYIDRWFGFAIAAKTKQLIFDFGPFHATAAPYKFTFEIFSGTNSSHLQSVKLGGASLKQPESFNGFLNIKKLELKDVDITDAELQLLLPKCHVLEFLGVSSCSLQAYRHLKTLEYRGSLVPLAPPGTLTGLCIDSPDVSSALAYFFNGLPSTLPHLETLTLRCKDRSALPDKTTKFIYLRHLRLDLFFPGKMKADALDFACLLEAAPFLENLELHMWMSYDRLRYCKRHGELGNLPSHPHPHLKLVNTTGFFGLRSTGAAASYPQEFNHNEDRTKADGSCWILSSDLSRCIGFCRWLLRNIFVRKITVVLSRLQGCCECSIAGIMPES
uniref:At1g61320/AtMIF1 LRR domain-containing protein n=1 Tax=Oryza punctata TaxID=4537 RepID=A0A0E0LHE4_ORYPU